MSSSTKQIESIQSAQAANIHVKSSLQYLALALHCFLITEGFKCVVEQPSSVPGFAPSLRDLPPKVFIPPDWNIDPVSVSLLYKHRLTGAKIYLMKVTSFDASSIVSFSQQNGADINNSIELINATYVVNSSEESQTGSPLIEMYSIPNLEDLYSQLFALVEKIAPALKPVKPMVFPNSPVTTESILQPLNMNIAPNSHPSYVARNITSVGSADLDPFSNLPNLNSSPGFARPEGGSLIGPNHPIFSGGQQSGPFMGQPNFDDPPFLPGFAAPQPRFDPFGPVLRPNSDIYWEDDPDGPNIPGGVFPGGAFPGRGGRGRGRVGNIPRRTFPGEPNPDHLKPPGW